MERLQKVMANAGIASRRKCEEYILAGRVKVNGQTIRVLGTKADAFKDKIEVDDKPLGFSHERVYILVNKPAGYLTTVKDPFGRAIVFDLLDRPHPRVFPVGRLDRDSEGVLLLTNDGELAYRMTHPTFGLKRTYRVVVRGHPEGNVLKCLRQGIILEDGLTALAEVKLLERHRDNSVLEIVIKEGRKRQVRRMFEKAGHPVINLRRLSLGPIGLGSLGSGKSRPLSSEEIRALQEAVGIG